MEVFIRFTKPKDLSSRYDHRKINKCVPSPPACMLMIQPEVLQWEKTSGNSRKLTRTLHCPIACHFLHRILQLPQRKTKNQSGDHGFTNSVEKGDAEHNAVSSRSALVVNILTPSITTSF
ncbi:hypothetical protein EYF80_026796 [Liparis tanakae]|uniref:Uncharacterized protein n=1 Tax=Liparis tanakae TaxID=230148 RepID=A0A4Z2HAR3_9TELE|nr:hypothetical protein EYF80_026796 [Liparis tanakae]